MRVAIISYGKEPMPIFGTCSSSIDTYSYYVARELSKLKIYVDIYANHKSKTINEKFRIKKIFYPHSKYDFVNKITYNTLILTDLIKNKNKYDIIHTNTSSSVFFISTFFNNIIFTPHSPYWSLSERIIWRQIKAVKKSRAVIAISRVIEERAKRYNKNTFYIPNGVDTKIFRPPKNKKPNFNILSVGVISRRKGLIYIAKALKDIKKENKEVKWLHIGRINPKELDYYKILMKYIIRNNLANNCKFLGPVDTRTMIQYYQNSTLFILPSLCEGLPLVVLEAMSCGLPVIASDIEGVRDVVKKEFLFPPTDVNKMKELILSLLYDRRKLRKISRENRKIVEMNFSWEVVAKKIKQVYEFVISNQKT